MRNKFLDRSLLVPNMGPDACNFVELPDVEGVARPSTKPIARNLVPSARHQAAVARSLNEFPRASRGFLHVRSSRGISGVEMFFALALLVVFCSKTGSSHAMVVAR